jgi:hypothetical protein
MRVTFATLTGCVLLSSALAATGSGPAASSAPAAASQSQPASRPKLINPPGGIWWENATSAPAYEKAAAHAPRFDDKALWPQLTGKEKYLQQQWPQARVLVWGHPGQSARFHPKRIGLDPTDPKNWIEYASADDAVAGRNGKPCENLLLDGNTDMVFPASDTPYSVGFRDTNVRETCRHLTVERNAGFIGDGRTIHGNVWVKKDGQVAVQGGTTMVGTAHTFFRNDNYGADCSQYFIFGKDQPDQSVEFLGFASSGDEWKLNRGTVIIGPDSVMQPGRAAEPFITKDGTLVLLDGAYWGKWCNEFAASVDLRVTGGLVQAGLPDRPLTRDCWLAFSFRNWADLDLSKWPSKRLGKQIVGGIFEQGATIRTVAAPGSKATLIMTRFDLETARWRGNGYFHSIGTWHTTDPKYRGLFGDPEFMKVFTSKPFKTVIFIAKGTTIDGLRFDEFPPGGIMMQEPSERAGWKNVTYGPNNMGSPDELVKQLDTVARDGSYGSRPAATQPSTPAASKPAPATTPD